MNDPKHISEVILSILTKIQAMENKNGTGYHKDVTNFDRKDSTEKKRRLKRGFDYDLDENGNKVMREAIKTITVKAF